MSAILTEILTLLTSGITQFATGFGSGLMSMVTSIFLTGEGDAQKLSLFGGLCIVFAGISLAIGLSRWVLKWVSSLGN